MNDDNTRQVMRDEETVVAGEPERTVVSETQTTSAAAPVAPVAGASQTTVQSTTTDTTPSERVVSRNVAERVVDPAAERFAVVDWVNRLIWLIIGIMVILLAIRFVLLIAGANPDAGFAEFIYGVTNWMVAPFAALFGAEWNLGAGAVVESRFAPEILVAMLVYFLIGWLLTKLIELLIGTNRTTGTVVSDTKRETKL